MISQRNLTTSLSGTSLTSLSKMARIGLICSGLILASCVRITPAEQSLPGSSEPGGVIITLTPLPPSGTPPPSATPSTTPSLTPSATATEGPTPTATIPPLPTSDPRYGLNLAAPSYTDGFNSHVTWAGPNFEGALNMIVDGNLVAEDRLADGFFWWSTTVPDIEAGNVYVEITAQPGECAEKDSYGLALRVDSINRNSGYALEFSCDGAYRMRKLFAGRVDTLIEWTDSNEINDGPNSSNQMGLLADGTRIALYANGELLETIEDPTFYSGNYALYSNAETTPGFTVAFDDFMLWYILP